MSGALTYSGELTVTACWCGIAVAIPGTLYREAQAGRTAVYCPVGHSFTWRGENTTEAKLRSRLAAAERRADNAAEREAVLARRLTAAKGEQTKLRKRIAAGVCPCCKRSFVDLARHIAGQHPDFPGEVGS